MYKSNEHKLKISYQSHWSPDGTHYDQLIKIDKQTAFMFNRYIDYTRNKTEESIKGKNTITEAESKVLYFLEPIKYGKYNYTHLTTLNYFISFYKHYMTPSPKKNKDFERILNRNTIIEVI